MFVLSATIDPAELSTVLNSVNLSDGDIHRAINRALRKTAKRTESRVSSNVAKQSGVLKRALKVRLKVYEQESGNEIKVWFGLNDLPVHLIGKPRQTRAGVSVGKHQFPGAFIMHKWGGKVFQRYGEKRQSKRSIWLRQPIKSVTVEIESVGDSVMRSVAREAESYFMNILRQELNYELIRRQ